MILPILYPSAMEFWMNSRKLDLINLHSFQKRKLVTVPAEYDFCPGTEVITWVIENLGIKEKLVLMAPSSEMRRWNRLYDCKIRREALPDNSFVCVGRLVDRKKGLKQFSRQMLEQMEIRNICVASPEFCFLQAAVKMPFLKLVKLGYDLCAMYISTEEEPYRQTRRDPITNAASIAKFLETCEKMPGARSARSAVRFVLDNSNSPMETKLCIIMILPLSFGGYGISKPELNKVVHLSKEAARYYGAETCCCDMVWEELKVIVEYDSNMTHLSIDQHARDKARITALQMSGYKVFTLTADKLRPDKIDETMFALKKELGKRVRKQDLERFRTKRESTRKYLFEEMDQEKESGVFFGWADED